MNIKKSGLLATCMLSLLIPSISYAAPVDYDIVYVKQPRKGDDTHTRWPEAFHPGHIEPNSDLMLLHPDGSEEILVDTEFGAVTDPFISFDGEWVYYSLFHDVRKEELNSQRGNLPFSGADIFRIHIQTRKIEQLTNQEFTPNTGTGNWDESNPVRPESGFNSLKYGILNTGPAPLAGGKIVFTSNRNGFRPTKSYTNPTMQLFVMDHDGSNVTPISPMTIGSSLHPTPTVDGKILFSSYESQGLRDQRDWGLWSIYPDGRKWEPVLSSFGFASVFHFVTQLSDQSVVVEDYYNLNNFGFGALYRIPKHNGNGPAFNGAMLDDNPPIVKGGDGGVRIPFSPKGIFSVTPLSTADDHAAKDGAGKYTQPSAAPNNDLLVAWSGGPVNKLNRPVQIPAVDSGLYLIKNGDPIESMDQLILIKNDPNYNEVWPRAVVKYKAIHGVDEPKTLPWLPNDGQLHTELPEGTPYGLVGTSSFYNRESFPGWTRGTDTFNGLDAFNTSENNQSSNWATQGADAGLYNDSDIHAVRILLMEPNPDRGYGPHSSPNGGRFFDNHANERLRILGEIPLRKFDQEDKPILDYTGAPDTSFLAKIPADTPFTFQTIDKNGMVLNMAQTWHQVRPGEVRTDCGGCHAHSQDPVDFSQTAAAKSDYQVWDLSKSTPLVSQNELGKSTLLNIEEPVVNVEFYQDIRPILQEKCTSCHTQKSENPPANLIFDDHDLYKSKINIYAKTPGDYKRLCDDRSADWGIPPLVFAWRQFNASRYVKKFQSRRSLLLWKIFGERLDGWHNDDHPSAAILGDATSLPEGAKINHSDLDYIGSIMPPADQNIEPLTINQKMNFARWIDLGCPIDTAHNTDHEGFGWFADDLRPVLTVSSPRSGKNTDSIKELRVGFADAYTGIEDNSLSVISDISIDGQEAGSELAQHFVQVSQGVYAYQLNQALEDTAGTIHFSIKDKQGNITRDHRKFSVGQASTDTLDQDNDGLGDKNDNCPNVANPGQWDKDKDDLGNACDDDIDGDGFTNQDEISAGSNPWLKDSIPNELALLDNDEDGIVNGKDNCPNIANKGQWDKDKDSLGNECDNDIDGDSFSNQQEIDAGSNPWHKDSIPDKQALLDNDDDGIINGKDNCPNIANKAQWDKDTDGLGNECDNDIDGDGFTNQQEIDAGSKAWDKNSIPERDALLDSDEDGIINNKDNCPNTANEGQWDKDKDGVGNACDDDIDGDGFTNQEEIKAKTKVWDANSKPHS